MNRFNLMIFVAFLMIMFGCESNYYRDFFLARDISVPFQLTDSVAFNKWNPDDLIDTNDVKRFRLISSYINKDYPLNIKETKATFIGQYRIDKICVLIYKLFTTGAGRGNPIVVIATFTSDLLKIDSAIVLWNDAEDPLYSQKVKFEIIEPYKINTIAIKRKYGFLAGKIVLKECEERKINLEIDSAGLISTQNDTSKIAFIDPNPDILDNFPLE